MANRDGDWAPGLKARRNKDGSVAWYWVASDCSKFAKDYPVKTVRLTQETHEERAEYCRKLYIELQQFLQSDDSIKTKLQFDGTVRSLIEQYELHPDSPYHSVKHTTREVYDSTLANFKRTVGQRALWNLNAVDFIRWHKNFMNSGEGEERHVHKAYKQMEMFRRVVRWGVALELDHCKRLNDILSAMTFENPKPRNAVLTFDMARAIIDRANEIGRPSIALVQALQFDCAMRRIDIIGEWIPALPNERGIILASKTVRHRLRWDNGLTWNHISADWILRKVANKTSKRTAAEIHIDLKKFPLALEQLQKVPPERRIGPVAVSEVTRQPYTASSFQASWRKLADQVGIPRSVWNMDSRAGGITEGSDAGAPLEHLRHLAAHKNASVTARYSRKTLEKTSNVAELRQKFRERKD